MRILVIACLVAACSSGPGAAPTNTEATKPASAIAPTPTVPSAPAPTAPATASAAVWRSPDVACGYLEEAGLKTRGYKQVVAEDYGCGTSYIEFGPPNSKGLRNTISYRASGSSKAIELIALELNVNDISQEKAAIEEFQKYAALLFKKLTGQEPGEDISRTIKPGEKRELIVNGVRFELSATSMAKGSGYELDLLVMH